MQVKFLGLKYKGRYDSKASTSSSRYSMYHGQVYKILNWRQNPEIQVLSVPAPMVQESGYEGGVLRVSLPCTQASWLNTWGSLVLCRSGSGTQVLHPDRSSCLLFSQTSGGREAGVACKHASLDVCPSVRTEEGHGYG